jgi:predicted enzyme related to lactoylglutathione lyase
LRIPRILVPQGETIMAKNHGNFLWYDVMTTDTKAAAAFYSDVVGWRASDSGLPGQSYTIFSAGETGVGGLMALPDHAAQSGMRPTWTGYIGVDDVDEAAAKLKEAGGAVHRGPEPIPGVGRMAVVSDPHGAAFILFKGDGAPSPPRAPGTPGTTGWHELRAGDRESDFAFYAGLFGWTKDHAMDMGPMGLYQIFAKDGVQIGGIMTKTADTPVPSWLYYFSVADIDAAAGRVTNGGGAVLNGPTEVPGGLWVVQCRDPQGAMFALVGPRQG